METHFFNFRTKLTDFGDHLENFPSRHSRDSRDSRQTEGPRQILLLSKFVTKREFISPCKNVGKIYEELQDSPERTGP